MLLNLILESFLHFAVEVANDFLGLFDFSSFIESLSFFVSFVFDILAYIYFFLPVTLLIPLINTVFAVIVVRIIISVIRLICEIK